MSGAGLFDRRGPMPATGRMPIGSAADGVSPSK